MLGSATKPTPSHHLGVDMLVAIGDSIVAAGHLRRPPPPAARRRTLAWLALGALLLATFAAVFAAGVRRAAANETARHRWIEVERRPAHEFRPAWGWSGDDALAAFTLVGGLLALGAGLSRARDQRRDVAPFGADELVIDWRDDGLSIRADATPPMHEPGRRLAVTRGIATLAAEIAPSPATLAPAPWVDLDRDALLAACASTAAHAGMLAVFATLPPSPRTLGDGWNHAELGRSLRVLSAPREPERLIASSGEPGGDRAERDAEAAPGEAGVGGRDDVAPRDGRRLAKRRAAEQTLSRAEVIGSARSAGILRAFGADAGGAPFAELVGDSWHERSGMDELDTVGGALGPHLDAYAMLPGTALRGTGPGGGGDDPNTLRVGGYATIGDGDRDGSGGNGGPGARPSLRRTPRRIDTVTIGRPAVASGYDKALIRRYLRQQRERLRHCYERALVRAPALGGTVTAVFTIDGRGAVVSSTAEGVSTEVATCVAGVMRRIRFPRAELGGLHRVTYPLHFRPAGS